MATINTQSVPAMARRGFAKKHRTALLRIDMTPMVDLGFLLITFFIFTSTLSTPNTMNLFMPATDGPLTPTAESGVLNIIVGDGEKIFYYEGGFQQGTTNIQHSSIAGIRNEIIRKKSEVIKNYKIDANCETKAFNNKENSADCAQQKLMVLIKPTKDANYKSLVNVLDEMTINKIARYVIAEPDEAELLQLPLTK